MVLTDMLFGRRLATDEEGEQRVGVLAAIPMLGLDALGSAAYGPEAALTLLIPLGVAGLGYIGPISALIITLLLIVYFRLQGGYKPVTLEDPGKKDDFNGDLAAPKGTWQSPEDRIQH